MKIRNGFVSNSSSSSFVVLLPKGFETQIDTMDLSKYDNGDKTFGCGSIETTEEKIRNKLHELVRSKNLWEEDYWEECQVIEEIVRDIDLIISVINSGPEEGQICVADEDAIQKILSKYYGVKHE